MNNFHNVTRLQWVKRSIAKGPVCANFTDTHRRQFYWIYNGYNMTIISDALIFFLKYILQCQVIGYAHLWLALPNAPHLGVLVPNAPFSCRWQPGRRKGAFPCWTCPTPSRRPVLNRASRNARIGTYNSMFIWYFRARKLLISVNRVSRYCCLSVFDFIRQITIRTAQQWRIIGACFRFRTDIANLASLAKYVGPSYKWNILLTKETSNALELSNL